jgi:uncharacterized membrane protein
MGNKYLQENKKAKRVLKIVGFISLILGIILTVAGFISVFNDFNDSGEPFLLPHEIPRHRPGNPGLIFLGFPLIFIGGVCLSYAYMGKVARYTASEMAPVAKDTANYMIDGTKDEIIDLISKIKGNTKINCPYCGDENDSDAVYCDYCGRKLKTVV